MLFSRKLQQPNTPKRIKRLPASPKALGLAAFSLVGLCFGSAVYLAAMPGLIAQSPAVSVASEAGEKASDEANAAFEAAKETVKKSLWRFYTRCQRERSGFTGGRAASAA